VAARRRTTRTDRPLADTARAESPLAITVHTDSALAVTTLADFTPVDFTEYEDPVEQRPQTRPHPHVTTLVRLPQPPVSDLLEPVGTWVACPSHRRPGVVTDAPVASAAKCDL
jgi:hypothetical protein